MSPDQHPRMPLASSERLRLGDLHPGPRARLTAALYSLWSEYFVGADIHTFTKTHIYEDTRLILGFGPGGDLAAFANLNVYALQVGTRRQRVITSGLFIRQDYRATAQMVQLGTREGLRIWSEHPTQPLGVLTLATHPLSFSAMSRLIRQFYPHPECETPSEIVETMHTIARLRNLPVDPKDPFLIRFPARSRHPDRIRASRTYRRGGPAIDRFESRAPDWAEGQALMVYMPFNTTNVRGVIRQLPAAVRARLHRRS